MKVRTERHPVEHEMRRSLHRGMKNVECRMSEQAKAQSRVGGGKIRDQDADEGGRSEPAKYVGKAPKTRSVHRDRSKVAPFSIARWVTTTHSLSNNDGSKLIPASAPESVTKQIPSTLHLRMDCNREYIAKAGGEQLEGCKTSNTI